MLILHIQEEVEMEVTEVGMVVIEGVGEEEELPSPLLPRSAAAEWDLPCEAAKD